MNARRATRHVVFFYNSLVAARGKTRDEHDILRTFAGRVNDISAIHCVLQGNLQDTSLAGRLAKKLSCGRGFRRESSHTLYMTSCTLMHEQHISVMQEVFFRRRHAAVVANTSHTCSRTHANYSFCKLAKFFRSQCLVGMLL